MQTEPTEDNRWRFTVHDYHRMGEAGILHEDDRVELIDGELAEMTTIGSRHFAGVKSLNRLLMRSVGDGAIVNVQNPVGLDEHNEPQPDLTVIRPRNYRISLPSPKDVPLLMEVSDTNLPYDRNVKLPLYSRAGIGEVWIVVLPGGTIERHTDPSEDGYRGLKRVRRAETMGSVALPDLALTVDDVLG